MYFINRLTFNANSFPFAEILYPNANTRMIIFPAKKQNFYMMQMNAKWLQPEIEISIFTPRKCTSSVFPLLHVCVTSVRHNFE